MLSENCFVGCLKFTDRSNEYNLKKYVLFNLRNYIAYVDNYLIQFAKLYRICRQLFNINLFNLRNYVSYVDNYFLLWIIS